MSFWRNQLSGPTDPARDAAWTDPPPRKGFFTDTSICIGCKACEVACKEWNQLPMDRLGMTGASYDNSIGLGASTWRHVAFVEQTSERIAAARETGRQLVDLGMPTLRAAAPMPGVGPGMSPGVSPGVGPGLVSGPLPRATAQDASRAQPQGITLTGPGTSYDSEVGIAPPGAGGVLAEASIHQDRHGLAGIEAPVPVGPGVVDLAEAEAAALAAARSGSLPDFRWLIASDVCKHCTHAACLDVCPTGSLFRSEFGTVVVQDEICNGCGYCVAACPFGVIERREDDGAGTISGIAAAGSGRRAETTADTGIAAKCTLCYDRLRVGTKPACAQACPTTSIQFGDLEEMRTRATERLAVLHGNGFTEARLYGANPNDGVGGTGSVFLLLDEPEVYGLPPDPVVTTHDLPDIFRKAGYAGLTMLVGAALSFLGRRDA